MGSHKIVFYTGKDTMKQGKGQELRRLEVSNGSSLNKREEKYMGRGKAFARNWETVGREH